jgi:hypothetical protein
MSAALPLHQALYNLPPSHITGQLKGGGEREREKEKNRWWTGSFIKTWAFICSTYDRWTKELNIYLLHYLLAQRYQWRRHENFRLTPPMSPFHGKLKRSVFRWKIKERSWRTFHRRTNVLESKIFEFYDWEGGIFLRFVVSGQQELECFALDFDLEIDRKSKFLIRKELKRNLLFHWIINLSRYDVRNTLSI